MYILFCGSLSMLAQLSLSLSLAQLSPSLFIVYFQILLLQFAAKPKSPLTPHLCQELVTPVLTETKHSISYFIFYVFIEFLDCSWHSIE